MSHQWHQFSYRKFDSIQSHLSSALVYEHFAENESAVSRITEKRNFLALWVNFYVEENNKIIGWYDHDYFEGYSTDFNSSIDSIVENMLVSEPAKQKILKALESLDIGSIEYVFTLKGMVYDGPAERLNLSESQIADLQLDSVDSVPAFVGNFQYRDWAASIFTTNFNAVLSLHCS